MTRPTPTLRAVRRLPGARPSTTTVATLAALLATAYLLPAGCHSVRRRRDKRRYGLSGCVTEGTEEEEPEYCPNRRLRSQGCMNTLDWERTLEHDKMARTLLPLTEPRLLQWGMSDESRDPPVAPYGMQDADKDWSNLDTTHGVFGGLRRRGDFGASAPRGPQLVFIGELRPKIQDAVSSNTPVLLASWRGYTLVRSPHAVELVPPSGPISFLMTGTAELRRTGNYELVVPGAGERGAAVDPYEPSDRPYFVTPAPDAAMQRIGDDTTDPDDAPALEEGSEGYRCDLLYAVGDLTVTVHHLAHGTVEDSSWRMHAMRYDHGEPFAGVVAYDVRAVAAAMDDHGLIIATDQGIAWTDMVLRPTHEVPVPLHPIAMSVGLDDSVYLINDEPLELIRFSSHGRELFRRPLAGVATQFPAAITEEGVAIVPMVDRVVAVAPLGDVLWEVARDSNTPVFIADTEVLMSDQNRALAVGPEGTRRLLWKADSRLLSAPTIVRPEVLLMATSDMVLELVRKP